MHDSDSPLGQANAGDSRSVISVKGEVKELSSDHKPLDASELQCVLGQEHTNVSDNYILPQPRKLGYTALVDTLKIVA
jgi:protein phosphatase 2C family protein 2/3